MSRPSLRCIAALALGLVLVASGPLAGKTRTDIHPRATVTQESVSAPPWKVLWNLVLSLWSPVEDTNPSWTKGGCSIDPFGRCLPDQTPTGGSPELEGGCSLDPGGACR